MPLVSAEYQRLVLSEVQSYKGLARPVKARLPERLFLRRMAAEKLHPNPGDEFTNPEIGPSPEAMSRYVDTWRRPMLNNSTPEIEPLSVEKTSIGGYMLLDGHHRWFAARQMGIKVLPVRVMNVTPVEQVLDNIAGSTRRMCASFDLDEVLLTQNAEEADRPSLLLFRYVMKQGLRKRAPTLIKELQNLGFDVWVYSSGFIPEDRLRKLFRFHGVQVDGIVNGIRNRQAREVLRKAFTERYEVSVHIDNEGILAVDTRTKDYEETPVNAGGGDWGAKSFAAVKANPIVAARLKRV